jgi:hypothetical protein
MLESIDSIFPGPAGDTPYDPAAHGFPKNRSRRKKLLSATEAFVEMTQQNVSKLPMVAFTTPGEQSPRRFTAA